MNSNLRNLKRRILADLKVELLDEFDRNFERRAFFDRPWPERSYPGGRGSLLQVTGRGRRSFRGTILQNGVEFSTDTPYMGLHNRGGKIKITPRMRKFFWAMYYKNGGKSKTPGAAARYWRNLALTKKDAITIPQQQIIGDHPRIRQVAREVIHQDMQSAFRELAKALRPR